MAAAGTNGRPNYRLDQIMWRMLKPVAERGHPHRGEAYSYGQGWVEGALDTAEQMLREPFRPEAAALARCRTTHLMPCPEGGCGGVAGDDGRRLRANAGTSDLRRGARRADAELPRQAGHQLRWPPPAHVAEYLIARLKQAGLGHLFAVPGDYASPFLDALDATAGHRPRRHHQRARQRLCRRRLCPLHRASARPASNMASARSALLNCAAGSFVERVPVAIISASPAHQRIGCSRHRGSDPLPPFTGDLRGRPRDLRPRHRRVRDRRRSGRRRAGADRPRDRRDAHPPPADLSRGAAGRLDHGLRRSRRARSRRSAIASDARFARRCCSTPPGARIEAADAAGALGGSRDPALRPAGPRCSRSSTPAACPSPPPASARPCSTRPSRQFIGTYAGPASPAAHPRGDDGHRLPDRARHDHHRRLSRHHGRELRRR